MEQNISVQVCICSTESMSHNFDAGVVSWNGFASASGWTYVRLWLG